MEKRRLWVIEKWVEKVRLLVRIEKWVNMKTFGDFSQMIGSNIS